MASHHSEKKRSNVQVFDLNLDSLDPGVITSKTGMVT